MSAAPQYYKSPARRPREEAAPGRRVASKSPGHQAPARHGQSAHIAGYLKLLEELKQLSGSLDETSVELGHLAQTFHKRCRLLRDPQLAAQAEELRRNAGIPGESEEG